MTLLKFFWIKRFLDRFRHIIWTRVWGMTIHPSARISLSAKLDYTHPRGVVIKERCTITFGAVILTHDMTRRLSRTTTIEADSFVGGRAIVLPGVRIGPNAIVAAGAVVTRDVAPNTIVAGNPARVIETDVKIGRWGMLQAAIDHDGPVYDQKVLKGRNTNTGNRCE